MSSQEISDFARRRAWFDSMTKRILDGEESAPWRNTLDCSNEWPGARVFYTCPCCGFPTLDNRRYDTCFLCGWDDDGQDDPRADEKWGGSNYYLTLSAARANFADHLCVFDLDIEWRFHLIRYHMSDSVLDRKRQAICSFDAIIQATSRNEQTEHWATVDQCISDMFDEQMRQSLAARSDGQQPQ